MHAYLHYALNLLSLFERLVSRVEGASESQWTTRSWSEIRRYALTGYREANLRQLNVEGSMGKTSVLRYNQFNQPPSSVMGGINKEAREFIIYFIIHQDLSHTITISTSSSAPTGSRNW